MVFTAPRSVLRAVPGTRWKTRTRALSQWHAHCTRRAQHTSDTLPVCRCLTSDVMMAATAPKAPFDDEDLSFPPLMSGAPDAYVHCTCLLPHDLGAALHKTRSVPNVYKCTASGVHSHACCLWCVP